MKRKLVFYSLLLLDVTGHNETEKWGKFLFKGGLSAFMTFRYDKLLLILHGRYGGKVIFHVKVRSTFWS